MHVNTEVSITFKEGDLGVEGMGVHMLCKTNDKHLDVHLDSHPKLHYTASLPHSLCCVVLWTSEICIPTPLLCVVVCFGHVKYPDSWGE